MSVITPELSKLSRPPSRLRRIFDSDMLYAFLRSPLIMFAALIAVLLVGSAFLSPLIAPARPL